MIAIRPISDLRNKFTDIEKVVNGGEPVFLTKNGYGSMVVMSIETYSQLTQNVEQALDEADEYAETNTNRLSHEETFGRLRSRINRIS
jgi:prevent-host-death family protein